MDIPDIALADTALADTALADTGSRRARRAAVDTEDSLQSAVAAEAADFVAQAMLPGLLQALGMRLHSATAQAGCCRRARALRAERPPQRAAHRVVLPAHMPPRPDLPIASHSAKPAASDRPPGRAHSRTRCSPHFPGNNPRDAGCRTPCRKFWRDPSHRTAFGNRDRLVRSLVPLPLTEMKRIPANLDQIAALQRSHAYRLAGNKDRSG